MKHFWRLAMVCVVLIQSSCLALSSFEKDSTATENTQPASSHKSDLPGDIKNDFIKYQQKERLPAVQPTPTITGDESSPVRDGTPIPVMDFPYNPISILAIKQLGRWGDGAVMEESWSSKGDLLAVGTDIGVYLYKPLTMELEFFQSTAKPVEKLFFSPDDQYLLFTAGGLMVMDVAQKKIVWQQKLDFPASGLAYDAHQQAVVTLVRDGEELYVERWALQDGKAISRIQIHELYGEALALAPDGSLVADSAKGKFSNKIRFWSGEDGELLQEVPYDMATTFMKIQFSMDGERMLSQSYVTQPNTDIQLWDVAAKKAIGALHLPMTPDSAGFSWDHQSLAVTFSQEAQIFNLKSYQKAVTLTSENQFATHATAFSPDGKYLASGALEIWNLADKTITAYHDHAQRWSYAVSPDNHTLAQTDGDGIVVRKMVDGSPIHQMNPLKGKVNNLVYSPDGTRLAATTDSGNVYLWETANWNPIEPLNGSSSAAFSLSFSPDNTRMAASFINGGLKMWDIQNGKEVRSWSSTSQKTAAIAFSPQNALIELNNKDLNIWNWTDFKLLKSYKGAETFKAELVFNQDGNILIHLSQSIQLTFLENGQGRKCALEGSDWPESATLTPDGLYIILSDQDGKIHVISADTCADIYSIDNYVPSHVKLIPDISRLISAGGGIVQIWGIPK